VIRIIWSPLAIDDVEAIRAYVTRDSAHSADLLVERLVESCSRPRRSAPMPHPGPLRRVLSSESHAPRARQGCAGRQARRALSVGKDRGDTRSRWSATSLHPPGGVVLRRRKNRQPRTDVIPPVPSAARQPPHDGPCLTLPRWSYLRTSRSYQADDSWASQTNRKDRQPRRARLWRRARW
jgi:plasmid stabilization system protein ParE